MAIVPQVSALWAGDGSTTQFSFSFPYQSPADVYVEVDSTIVPTVFVTSHTVQITPAPAFGSEVLIYRSTPAITMANDFQLGAPFLPSNIDENFEQTLFALQEALDFLAKTGSTIPDHEHDLPAHTHLLSDIIDPLDGNLQVFTSLVGAVSMSAIRPGDRYGYLLTEADCVTLGLPPLGGGGSDLRFWIVQCTGHTSYGWTILAMELYSNGLPGTGEGKYGRIFRRVDDGFLRPWGEVYTQSAVAFRTFTGVSGSFTPDFRASLAQSIELSGNTTIQFPVNGTPGLTMYLQVIGPASPVELTFAGNYFVNPAADLSAIGDSPGSRAILTLLLGRDGTQAFVTAMPY